MCGIAGMTEGTRTEQVARMLEALGHRGPDGRGLWCSEHHSLGHTRLSIIDLEGGAQPMADEQDRLHITFNGEVYNFRFLRKRLGEEKFRTQSDTEVIVQLARTSNSPDQWVRHLDGMFAFAIARGDELILARDPLGIKPLYIGQEGQVVVFASELKALGAECTNITEFPPGHVYSSRGGLRRYYELGGGEEDVIDAQAAEQGLRERLEAAVRKRLIADVPVGVFLSGGLDSSVISALARRHKDPLDSFSVATENSPDRQPARQMAQFLGTRHHERIYTIEEAIEALPQVIYYLESFDCALVRSAIPNFFLAKLASEHVKVALSGEGADELFAGYAYLKDLPLAQLRQELRLITSALHNTNLQRCDRMSMAHGLEVRVPFLDVAVVDWAFRMPVELKQHGPERLEKWILRKMAEPLLPPEIAWRQKVKFAAGSGLGEEMARFAEKQISDGEFAREREIADGLTLRSKEELLYYRFFKQAHRHREILQLVGRSRSV